MVDLIAKAIDAVPKLAPFQLPGGAVFQFTVEGQSAKPSAMVTLWPSLGRVDVVGAGAAIVFTRVAAVQLVDDVEIVFRRESGEYLIVSKNGKIIVRC